MLSTEPGSRQPAAQRAAHNLLLLLAAANFLHYANRNILSLMYPALRQRFGFSDAQLGLFGSLFMFTHALANIPIGWAGDRFDRRRLIACGILLWSVAALAAACAGGFTAMALARALGGLATAACVPVANALICEIFPAERKARSVSVFNVGLFLGGAGGIGLGGLLGFPAALWAAGLPGFALALAVARAPLPAAPAAAPAGQAAAAGARRLLADAAVIARIPTMRWMLLGAIAISFAAGGYLTWFGDFVAAAKGLSIEQATVLLGACALTGGLAGVVSGGVVADRLRTRVASGRLLAISASFAAAVPCALGALYIDAGPGFYAASWLLLFFISWYHAPMAASVDDLVSPARAATAQAAFISTMHLLGTAPSAYLVGWLADRHGLRTALLVPTAAVLLAALAFAGGLRSFARDQAARDRH